jgi:hypothetical protein
MNKTAANNRCDCYEWKWLGSYCEYTLEGAEVVGSGRNDCVPEDVASGGVAITCGVEGVGEIEVG